MAWLGRVWALASEDSDDFRDHDPAYRHECSDPLASADAFESFVRGHERDIVGYLWRMTGDEQAARDLAQETFLRAWQRFDRVQVYERPSAWLYRVATHLALNHLRARRVFDRVFTLLSANPSAAMRAQTRDHAGVVAEQDTVRCALGALSPGERAALVLHEIAGLSCAELAATLDISLAAAKMTLWRARERFRQAYTREEAADALDAD
jgi:RNA polymerase sigma-70 factor (ECF subfamily)